MKFNDLINEAPVASDPQHTTITYEDSVSRDEVISLINTLDEDELDFILSYLYDGLEALNSIYDTIEDKEELDYDPDDIIDDDSFYYDLDYSDIDLDLTERPKAVIKAAKLRKMQKYHKTSNFRNVVKRLNQRERRSAEGIKKKRLRKKYMKRYTQKYKNILKIKSKKYRDFNK